MTLNIQTQKDLFFSMLRIRRIEEAIADRYKEQKMRTPVHLSIGQESVASIVGYFLQREDYAVGTHRAHAHYLGKGGSLNAMIAEMHGKVTGCCRGRGGSMHLIDTSVGFMGSTAIVGNTIPIGVGLGLSIKLSGKNTISCIFIGDGAIEEGVFFESINFSVLKNLPVLFICENNRYSVYSHFRNRQPEGRNIYDIAHAIGAKTNHANAYDVFETYSVTEQAIHSIRSNGGTHFLEYETYRWREHCGPNYDNDIGYRTEEEFLSWKKYDPIEILKKHLITNNSLTIEDIQAIEKAIQQEIDDAFDFAEQSLYPDPIEAVSGQYKEKEKVNNRDLSAITNECVL